jgi:hypothetical protein
MKRKDKAIINKYNEFIAEIDRRLAIFKAIEVAEFIIDTCASIYWPRKPKPRFPKGGI